MKDERPARRLATLGWLLAASAICGCGRNDGPPLAPVSGTITLDGRPLEKAVVTFSPRSGVGGPSYGVSDASGRYELSYTHEKKGAVVGSHVVTVSTAGSFRGNDNWGGDDARRPETLPARYNRNSELTVEVTPGGGPYDFDLRSDAGSRR